MKKLYYFSKSRLQFTEIKHFRAKIAIYFSIAVFAVTSLIFGGYSVMSNIFHPEKNISNLRSENEFLRNKILELADRYSLLNNELDSLYLVNNELRIASNLSPLQKELRQVGVGGGYFDDTFDFSGSNSDRKLRESLEMIEEVSRKIEFEKAHYLEISKKIIENEKLYASIPAIKPSEGSIGYHGFGMRVHPILRVKKMHDGIDIITDIGTPVFATGNGVVDFVGRKGGYGLTIEIEHGFGYRTVYAHLSSAKVKEGQKISRGDLIAKTGNSGLSAGPHLHYEVHHNGIKQNPEDFFFDDFNFFELIK